MSSSQESLRSSRAWAEPGVETIAEGVHRIPLALPEDALAAVNVYLVETEGSPLLIDGGWDVPQARVQLSQALAQRGYSLEDVEEIAVTHLHHDHYTLAIALRREIGTRVLLGGPEGDSLTVLQTDPTGGTVQEDLLRESGARELAYDWREWADERRPAPHLWGDPTGWLQDGMCIDRDGLVLRVVGTPGHTRGHMVFADESRSLLFSGDHVLPRITPSAGFEPVKDRLILRSYLDSLDRIRELPDMRLMPAHGPAGMSSVDRADEILAHHETRFREMLAVSRSNVTAYEVASQLSWTRHRYRFSELEPYNQALAVMETELHLEMLESRGDLRSTTIAGIRTYCRYP